MPLAMAVDPDLPARLARASDAHTDDDAQRDLAADPAVKVRRTLAKNAVATADALRLLARDTDEAVRSAVAGHPNTPIEAVEALVNDPLAAVRAKARRNRGLSRADKARLAAITDEGVLRGHLDARVATQGPRAEAFRARVATCSTDGASLPGRLRKRLVDALSQGPSPDAWSALCDALEGARWTDSARAAAAAWLEPQLAAWPDPLRVTDPRWMRRLDRDEDEPWLGLARTGVATGRHWSESLPVKLAACPWLAAWTTLDLHDLPLGPLGASVLFASPYLGALRALNLNTTGLGPVGTLHLVACPALSALASLSLGWCGLHATSFRALGDAPFAPVLQHLELTANGRAWTDTDAPGAHLTTWTRFAALESLRLTYNNLGDEGLAALLNSPQVARLRDLDLQANGLTDATAHLLASSPHLGRLERLVLVANFLSVEGMRALAASPHLGALRALDVSCAFAKAEAEAVMQALGAVQARGCMVTADVLDV